MYFYMDESGDLGFTRQLDKDYFVLAVLQTTTPKEVGNCISRARNRVLKKKRRQVSELKASASDERVRNYVLTSLARNPITLYFKSLKEARAAAERAAFSLQRAGVDKETIEALRSSKDPQESERGEALRSLWDLSRDLNELDALLADSPKEAAAFVEEALKSGYLLLGNGIGALRYWKLSSPEFAKKMLCDWIAHWQKYLMEEPTTEPPQKEAAVPEPTPENLTGAEEMPRPVKRKDCSLPPHPIGFYSARLISIEERESPVSGGSPQFFFWFETDFLDEETGEPMRIGHFTSQKLTPQSKLYQRITSITGSDETTLKQGIDLDDLIGTECQISVKHKKGNDGQILAYIESFQLRS